MAAIAGPARAENRVALVIGNDRYPNLPADKQLSKAVNDARAIGQALEKIGFTVIRGENLDRRGMVDRLFAFTQKIQPGDMAVVFYAGHGVAISGGNYLLPTDMPLPQPGEEPRVRNMAIGEADLVADIQEKKARVAVLMIDACRDNPFRQPGVTRSIGGSRGLARGREAEGVFAVYSAGFGQSALDSLGPNDKSPNSIFTRALVPQLARADAHLGDIIIDMREEVAKLAASIGHQQYPAYYDQTRGGRVYLAPRAIAVEAKPAASAVPVAPPPQVSATPPTPAPQQAAPQIAMRTPEPPRPAPSAATNYPQRPITLVVPFAPGGSTDILGRLLSERLSRSLGQPIVVENKPGAGGAIGAGAVARAPRDGYTLLLADTFMLTAARSLHRSLPYDLRKDFQPVGLAASAEMVLVVAPSVSARSVGELITLAKGKPGSLIYASSGVGSLSHLAAEMLASTASIKMIHVPYRGTGPSINDLAAGHVSISFAPISVALPLIQSGKLRALAVTGSQRARLLPNVATIAESGLRDFTASQQFGLYAPAGTPEPIVDKLNETLRAAAAELRERLAALGLEPQTASPRAHAAIIEQEDSKWSKVARDAGIQPN